MEILDIIFLILTVGIGYILYSTLGKRTGHQPSEPMTPIRSRWSKAMKAANIVSQTQDPIADSPLITGVKQLKVLDPKFDQAFFLTTTRNNFEAIIQGFVKGDLNLLKQSLTPALYSTYAKAIEDRTAAKQQAELSFFRFIRGEIKEIAVKDFLGTVSINFVSEQSQVIKDTHGKILEGNPDILDEINEIWVFEKDLKSPGSNWMLARTYAA